MCVILPVEFSTTYVMEFSIAKKWFWQCVIIALWIPLFFFEYVKSGKKNGMYGIYCGKSYKIGKCFSFSFDQKVLTLEIIFTGVFELQYCI